MKPDQKKHEFYITLDPETGIPVEVAARLQGNLMVKPSPNVALFQEAPYLFFPVFWFEQKVRVPKEMIDEIKIAASIPTIGYVCLGVIIAIGLIMLLWVGCQKVKKTNITKESKQKEALHGKNTIEICKIGGKLAGEQSPLMKEKPLQSDFTIKQISEKPTTKAPLAETDSDYGEKESIMTPMN